MLLVAVMNSVVVNLLINILLFVFIQNTLIDQLCSCLSRKHGVASRYLASIFGSALTNRSQSAMLWEIFCRPTARQSHSC
jgi:hypothetical protein